MKDKLAVLIFAVINVVLAVECPKDHDNWSEQVMKHEDCGKFYKCSPNGPIVMSCPEGLYFNPETYHCDWKENVYCSEENTSESKEIETEEEYDAASKEIDNSVGDDDSSESEIMFQENGCPVNHQIHWLLPDENDCSVFYYCVHGEKIKKSCPGNLHFNRDSQVCDWPDVAGCAKSSEDNDSDANASEVESTKEDLSSEESISKPDNSEEDVSEKDTSEEDTSDTVEADTKEDDSSKDDSQIDGQLFKKIETAVNVNLLHLAQ